MRVDWDQTLEGCSLLEIRNLLRPLSPESIFGVEFVARRLMGKRVARGPEYDEAEKRAKGIIDGLLVSGLIKVYDTGSDPSPDWFAMTELGLSLRAASATKRLKRERADKAVSKLLKVVDQINRDPIFAHDITWLAIYGSYLTDAPDLGDIDVAFDLTGRWSPNVTDDSERERLRLAFEAAYPPPESYYVQNRYGYWPETYTSRLLRVDPAINLIRRYELERLGCAYRVIFPEVVEVAALPEWVGERAEIVLRPDDGTAAALIEEGYRTALANLAKRRAANEAYLERSKLEQQSQSAT